MVAVAKDGNTIGHISRSNHRHIFFLKYDRNVTFCKIEYTVIMSQNFDWRFLVWLFKSYGHLAYVMKLKELLTIDI